MAIEQKMTPKHVSPQGVAEASQLAERKLQDEIKKNPKNIQALSMLAGLHMQKNEIFPAIQLLQRAIQLAPSSSLLNDLGVAYRKIGRPELALPVLQKAIALDGKNGNALYNYAGVLNNLGELEPALEYFRRAGETSVSLQAPAIAAAATIKEKMGRVDEAFADVMTLVKQGNKSPAVLRSLGNILQQHTKFCEYLDLGISLLVSALEEKTISSYEVNSYYFLLGNLYQKKKDFESAFISFEKGHQHSNRNYNEDFEAAVVEGIYQNWSAVEATTIAVNSPARQKLIFIVGMPRSGSTLVEQILSVFPESVALGECNFFTSSLAEYFRKIPGDPATKGNRPLSPEETQSIRSLYMQRAFQTRRPAAVITDKTLHNTLHVGQILQAFPNAKIIWTRRDPRDACLSCYTFDFAGSQSYRHDLRTLARYHNRIEKLMRFWQERYPQSVYAASYEEMIRKPAEKIRELVDFCDIPWSDDYLYFHQAKRTITTASYNQVTQPIYTSAIGRWKDYEKQLAPLLEELDLSPR